MGKLENFLIISKRGDAYLVHESNTTDIYSTYVPRWYLEINQNNHVYLF